jgi:hypothetical protein
MAKAVGRNKVGHSMFPRVLAGLIHTWFFSKLKPGSILKLHRKRKANPNVAKAEGAADARRQG